MDITLRAVAETGAAKIVFVSPLLDKETRTARVVVSLVNPDSRWRPGSIVTAPIAMQAGIRTLPGVVIIGGGLIVEAGGSLIGAVGVSGAPGGRCR